MPRTPLHALTWSAERGLYEWSTRGQVMRWLSRTDEASWQSWLGEMTSFAFHSPRGSLNVYQERRPRGGRYWYAYHSDHDGIRKRYLGPTARVTLARLEETAPALASAPPLPVPTTLMAAVPQSNGEPPPSPLAIKLTPPRLPNTLVPRERLLAALDRALTTPLTLLSAAAGWGKTTLLAAWARQHHEQVAWLSLDDLDNTPTRFWVALITTLRRCAHVPASVGETVLSVLQSPHPPPLLAIVTALLHDLDQALASAPPIILIMDDYQVITDPSIHESLRYFLEHPPAPLHVILASREDPELPLARWRARGQLTEIRADDLRFHADEASRFLSQMLAQPLAEEEVHLLERRTEGWIAGLQLSALALQRHADRAAFLQAFTGSQRYVLDYVQEDILARLPEGVRDFLLHTAILARLDADICQIVTGASTRAASQQLLEGLERANLFLVPLDEERHTYRLHDLFREALLAILQATQPEAVPLLHRRAAGAYAAQGEFHEAITHAFAAADYTCATRLMEQTMEQFWLRGEAATMARWALALPEQMVREHADLLLTSAFYLRTLGVNIAQEQRARVHSQMRQLIARVETALWQQMDESSREVSVTHVKGDAASPPGNEGTRAPKDALLHRHLHLLHLFIVTDEAVTTWEHERYNSMQQEIEEELERGAEILWQTIPLSSIFILHYTIRQEGASMMPLLLDAKARASRTESRYAAYKIRQYLALAAVEAGRLHLAYEESRAALALIKQLEGFSLLNGYFEMALAQVLYQWNRLEEARDLLRKVVHDATT